MASAEQAQNCWSPFDDNDNQLGARRSLDLADAGRSAIRSGSPLGVGIAIRPSLDASADQNDRSGVATPLSVDSGDRGVVNLGVPEQSVAQLAVIERPETRMQRLGRRTNDFFSDWAIRDWVNSMVSVGGVSLIGYMAYTVGDLKHYGQDDPRRSGLGLGFYAVGWGLTSVLVVTGAVLRDYSSRREIKALKKSLHEAKTQNIPLQPVQQGSNNV